jgi:serine/threonine protein kinase
VDDDRTRIAVRGNAVNIGSELNQTYRIDSLLGVGGMGEVFKGHNIQTGDPVAIKIVLPEFAQDETILNLFRKEARILNHLNHEAIVRYYVFSIDASLARPYLAMEFVDGPSLASHVKVTPLAPSDFMPLLRRLADGLHRAHIAGVIHRDMSPDNVILPEGQVHAAKIIDFGIARTANVGGETLLGGSFAGKYNYVSPEQLGLFGGEITPKSDIYGLALVMAAAIRGQPLDMSGSQVDVIEKRRVVPELKGIPSQFHSVLSAMLAPDPAARPADMAEVRDWPAPEEAAKAKPDRPKKAVPTQRSPIAPAPSSSNAMRNAIIGVGVLAVAVVGAVGGWIYVRGDQTTENQQVGVEGSTPAETPRTDAPEPADVPVASDVADSATPSAAPEAEEQAAAEPTPQAVETPVPSTPDTPEQPPVAEQSTATPPVEQEVARAPDASTTPPVSADPGPAQATSAAAMQQFVDSFGSEACFTATASDVTSSSADIKGLGTAEAGRTFTDAFAAKAGFAPALTLDQVSPQQCGFVETLRRMSVAGAEPLVMKVDSAQIRGGDAEAGIVGDPLKVSVAGAGDRNIYLFVMDHNGGIQNINRLCPSCITMSAGGLKADLGLSAPVKVEGEEPPPFYPMLVFAVASPKPLLTINAQDAFDAADFIGPFLQEIGSARDVATAVDFVRLTH